RTKRFVDSVVKGSCEPLVRAPRCRRRWHDPGHASCCRRDRCGGAPPGARSAARCCWVPQGPLPSPSPVTDPADRGEGHSRSEEHTSELQSRFDLVCRLLLEKKKIT